MITDYLIIPKGPLCGRLPMKKKSLGEKKGSSQKRSWWQMKYERTVSMLKRLVAQADK
jgi:hypothetical protein